MDYNKMDEILYRVGKIKGWFSGKNCQFCQPFIEKIRPEGLLVELGTYCGKSTLFFRLINPQIRILTIDICEKVSWADPSIPAEKVSPEVLKHGSIFQVVGDSSEVVKSFNWPIDLLFIDRIHTYWGVSEDIRLWTPFVKPDGVVLFHDYSVGYPGTIKAVDGWLSKSPQFVKEVSDDEMIAVRKNVD